MHLNIQIRRMIGLIVSGLLNAISRSFSFKFDVELELSLKVTEREYFHVDEDRVTTRDFGDSRRDPLNSSSIVCLILPSPPTQFNVHGDNTAISPLAVVVIVRGVAVLHLVANDPHQNTFNLVRLW